MMYGFGYGYGNMMNLFWMAGLGIFHIVVVAFFLYFAYDIAKSLRKIAETLDKNKAE